MPIEIGISTTVGGVAGNTPGGTPTPPFSNVNSFSFDGVDDYFLGVGNYNELNGVSIATFSFWLKPQDNGLRILLHVPKNNTNANGQFLIYQRSGRIQMNIDTASYYCRTLDNTLILNQWQHVMICMNLPLTGPEGKIFINGVDQTSTENWSNRTTLSTSTGGLYIGESNNGYLSPFYGGMDEVAIWSGTDLRNDVATIYNNGEPTDLNDNGLTAPTTWQRMGEDATWNGATWTMTDVNGGYSNRSINMVEANRTTDVPPNPFANTQSILLDGVDDYVEVADADNLSFGNGTTDSPFSISFWVNLDSLSGTTNVFIGKDNGGANREYAIGMFSNSDKVRFFIKNNGGSNQQSIDSTTQLTVGSWFHIVTTYDGSGGNNAADGMKIYINGSLQTSTNVVKQSYTAMKNTTAPLLLGKYAFPSSQISGTMDEISVFNTELSQSDVTTIYNGGVPNDISSLSPLSWWRCGDGDTSPTLTDNGSGGNDGTMTNFSAFSTDVPLFNTKSIALDGVDDFVAISANSNLQISDTFTISQWVKFTSTSQMYVTNFANKFGVYVQNGFVYLVFRNLSNSQITLKSASTINDGNYHNVTVVKTSSTMAIYIDGTLNASNTNGATGITSTSSNAIGALFNGAIPFLGNIDEVAIWNSDQSANASSIYNSGVPNDISSLSPLSWWRCGDGDTSPTLTDNGSGGNNGTMTNFTTFSTDVPT